MRGLITTSFLLAGLVLLPPPAAADVYKCTINGEVRYQGDPCPGDPEAKPHLAFEDDPVPAPEAAPAATQEVPQPRVPVGVEPKAPNPLTMLETARELRDRDPPAAPAPPPKDQPLTRTAELNQQIQAQEQALREIVDQRRLALGELDRRIAENPSDNALKLERRRRDSDFVVQRAEAGQRLEALRRELRELCPNGTYRDAGRLACR